MQSDKSRTRAVAPFLLLAGVFSLASCSSTSLVDPKVQASLESQPPPNPEDTYSYWDDQPGNGSLRVNIKLGEQTAYIYRGDTLIGRSRVATGLPGHRTPTGRFSIMEKTYEKRSNLYGVIIDANGNVVVSDADSRRHSAPRGGRFLGAEMPCWMRLTARGVGMHIGHIPNPGYPASHGCIRMRAEIAQQLFASSSIGTPVTIVQ